ncbi:MAG: hypothetical protein F6K24_12025 [Okeania sp. SIO2D1]|nr:hypothetical protein [Okeania sp. SIO2D1]
MLYDIGQIQGSINRRNSIGFIAGWHTTNKLVLPEGIDLFFLPHSPELQPAERLWPLTNEADR